MKLIADCGSTTTKWAMVGDSGATVDQFTSPGMNASLLSPDDLHTTLLCSLPSSRRAQEIDTVHFYAAGCRTGAQRATIADALGAVYPKARIYVDGDLIAAARALCGHDEGIACIMGTGSNCCLYSPDKGGRIVKSISPLGYILGDEGSGSAIGRRLVADALRGILPDDLCQAVMQFAGTDATGIIEHIYRRHDANRFLASFARLASDNVDRPEIKAIVDSCFDAFIVRNLMLLPGYDTLPIGFCGSIAANFTPILEAALARHGLKASRIEASPMPGLIQYHTCKKN